MKKHNINKTYSLQKVNGTLQGKLSADKKTHRKARKMDVIVLIVSLLFAVGIWLWGTANATTSRDFSIGLDIIGADHLKSVTGLAVYDELPTVTVHVQGRAQDLANVKAEDLKPYILADSYTGAAGQAEFKIEILKTGSIKNVTVETYPATVTLYLDEMGEKEVPVQVEKAFDANTTRELVSVQPTLKLTGPKQELDKIAGATLVVTNAHITQCQEYGVAIVYPVLTDSTGKNLNEIAIHVEKEPLAVQFSAGEVVQDP